MKKRSKLLISLVMCVLSLGMLVYGVWAAGAVTFNVTSNLTFTPDGVFAGIRGEVWTGTNHDDVTKLTTTGNSYDETNFDLEGNSATSAARDYFGSSLDSKWAIPDIAFTESMSYVEIRLFVTNYSDYDISFGLKNDITPITGVTFTELVTDAFQIAPEATEEYVLSIALNDFSTPITSTAFNAAFDVIKYVAPVAKMEYFNISNGVLTGLTSTYAAEAPKVLVIPEGVTEIKMGSEEVATMQLQETTNVILPSSLTKIGAHAFSGCTSLISVTIPDSVTLIDRGAFYNCTSLTSVTIPDSVTEIKPTTFSGCTSLTSVIIPDSVTLIKEWAFAECTSLTSITIPSTVTMIDVDAFDSSANLLIEVDANNANYSSVGGSLYNKEQTTLIFGAGKKVINDIPSTVIEIEYGAFSGHTTLTSLEIPNSVITLGSFSGCTALINLNIPPLVTEISPDAFLECNSLLFTVDESNESYSSFNGSLYNKNQTELIRGAGKAVIDDIPNSVETIGIGAFMLNNSLVNIIIPNSVITISDVAFNNCYSLTNITIPSSVKTIGDSVFISCTSLKSIYIPTNLALNSSHTLYGDWVYSATAVENPTGLTPTTEIPLSNNAGYYYQLSAYGA